MRCLLDTTLQRRHQFSFQNGYNASKAVDDLTPETVSQTQDLAQETGSHMDEMDFLGTLHLSPFQPTAETQQVIDMDNPGRMVDNQMNISHTSEGPSDTPSFMQQKKKISN